MSRKQKLSKKIAHTILAMSIVYSGGLNVLCNTAFAADGLPGNNGTSITKSEDISGGIDETYQAGRSTSGSAATDGDKGGKGGDGGSVTVNDTVTGTIGGEIKIIAKATYGQEGGGSNGNGQKGDSGNGGDSKVVIGVTGDGIETSHNITINATAGAGDTTDGPPGTKNTTIDGNKAGNGGEAAAIGLQVENKSTLATVKAADITISATGGQGGLGGSSYHNGAVGGIGGAAQAYGISASSSLLEVAAGDIAVTAIGGQGGKGGAGGAADNVGIGGDAGNAGMGQAWGFKAEQGTITGTISSITVKAQGGDGGIGGQSPCNGALASFGTAGAMAKAYGIVSSGNDMDLKITGNLEAEAIGGAGANGMVGNYNSSTPSKPDRSGSDGGDGSEGGTAEAYGVSLKNSGNLSVVTLDSISTTATAGNGGNGGNGGKPGVATINGSDGGDGGNGGNAYAYSVYASNSQSKIVTDTITTTAAAGIGGSEGTGSTESSYPSSPLANPGTDGIVGEVGAEAKAYGVYAEGGAVVNLSAKTENGTIKIGAKAENGLVKEAYAIYADSATVLFHSKATLNTSDGTNKDNAVMTYLNNATLGFGGTSADRTVTGGTLKLEGSNTFRFTTDLVNNTADSMTFETIENNGQKQYIQIGYEDAFKNAVTEGDIIPVDGEVTVLTIARLGTGQSLNNFVGQASELDNPLQRFKVTPTVEIDNNKVNISKIELAVEGASETVMTLADSQMALGSMWRIEGNNLMKRMGDLRNDSEAAKGGVWARYYRGELSANSSYDREFSQDYTAFQGGIDKVLDYKGGKLYTGIAINRIDSNMGYSAGSGDLSSTGVGVYTSWLGSKGHYFDVIARGSKLNNDMKLVDMSGNSGTADYSTWAYGISAEYGYRQSLQAGWFVEPQAELSLGHINSVDYTTSNGVGVKQDGVNSAVTRLGVLGGKEFTLNDRPSNAYVKASVLHDFGGNGGATAYYGTDSLAMQAGDLMGTWYEVGVGMNLGIAKNSNLYFDALKTFKGSIRTDWQINAGLRFTF